MISPVSLIGSSLLLDVRLAHVIVVRRSVRFQREVVRTCAGGGAAGPRGDAAVSHGAVAALLRDGTRREDRGLRPRHVPVRQGAAREETQSMARNWQIQGVEARKPEQWGRRGE